MHADAFDWDAPIYQVVQLICCKLQHIHDVVVCHFTLSTVGKHSWQEIVPVVFDMLQDVCVPLCNCKGSDRIKDVVPFPFMIDEHSMPVIFHFLAKGGTVGTEDKFHQSWAQELMQLTQGNLFEKVHVMHSE